jgi:hypothetical protein
MRRKLGPIYSPAYRPGAEAIAAAALAVTTESTSANEAAAAAARAAGWQTTDPGLARLRELLGEATWMRVECASTHGEQSQRLDALIVAQLEYLALLHRSGGELHRQLAAACAAAHTEGLDHETSATLGELKTWPAEVQRRAARGT